ncbi:MAG TPA: envelope stress response membrane protein PspC [Gammaproteobacteria bacterium]
MSRAYAERAGCEWTMNKLYRNRRQGMIFGVCAGIAEYFAIDVTVVRVLTVIGALIFTPMFLVAYVLLGFLLPVKPTAPEGEEERHWDPVTRQVRASPRDTLHAIRHRFTDLDMRLQRLEKYVTSQRYKLDREFEQLRD